MKTTVDFSAPSPYSQSLNESRLERFVHQATYRHQVNFIRKNAVTGASILDVGCGSGIFLNVAVKQLDALDFYGLDYDHRLLEEASKRVKECKFYQGSAEELPFESNKFDFVTSFHNIEHLYNPEAFITEARRVLCPNAYLLLATPNPESYVAKQLKEMWPASPTQRPDHISLKSEVEWRELFENNSFKVVDEGTTFFSSLPVVNKTPLKYVNQLFLYFLGSFPWRYGEAYQAIFQKV